MRIAVIQASSQRGRNEALFACTKRAVEKNGRDDEVVDHGVFADGEETFSYAETAVCVSLLLAGGAADFVVTGCSSGQGMMLACNALPGVVCGYLPTPQDAFLFGRINGGNAASLPLGLNYGWLGEINMQGTLDRLLEGPLGCGYPPEEAERKARDARTVREMAAAVKGDAREALLRIPRPLLLRALTWQSVRNEILERGKAEEIVSLAKGLL